MPLPNAHTPAQWIADDESIALAQRQLVGLLACCSALLSFSIALDRGALRAPGRTASTTSVTLPTLAASARGYLSGDPTIVVLRLLRLVMFFASAGLLAWLLGLVVVAVVGRQPGRSRVARLPFGRLVVRSVSSTLILALAGSLTASAATASSASMPTAMSTSTSTSTQAPHRPNSLVSKSDSTGGQRWPDLTPSSSASPPIVIPPRSPARHQPSFNAIPPPPVVPLADGAAISQPAGPTVPIPDTPQPSGPSEPLEQSIAFVTRGAAETTSTPDIPSAPPRTVTIGRGDSFWSIAESHVLTNMSEATEHDISRYWMALIDANKTLLPDPNNPDLLFFNSVVVLPPLDTSGADRRSN